MPRRAPQHTYSSCPHPSVACLILLDEQLLVLVRVHVRVVLVRVLGVLDLLDELVEILGDDGAILAAASDLRVLDVLLLDLPPLADLGGAGRELQTGALLGSGSRRLEVLHILEHDLALHSGAGHLADVDPVVPRELLSRRRGIHLGLLGSLREQLKILHADLVAIRGALESLGNLDTLSLRKLFRSLAGEAGDLLDLRRLSELLRQERLLREQLDGCVTIGRLMLQKQVDDRREGVSRGGHEYRVVCVVAVVAGAPLCAAAPRLC